jgi:hypothetical protein
VTERHRWRSIAGSWAGEPPTFNRNNQLGFDKAPVDK